MSCVTAGANVPDFRLLKQTIEAMVVHRPAPTRRRRQHLCLDKGYDYPSIRPLLETLRYLCHIPLRGEPTPKIDPKQRHPARRWVVERTLAWLSKCRALLVRYAKKACNYLGLMQLACALLWFRRLHRLRVLR